MNPESAPGPDAASSAVAELSRQRAALQQGLRRANFAWVVIVAVITVLAAGVVWKARQSTREAERANGLAEKAAQEALRANSATARAEAELWNARLTEARALRKAGGLGARAKSAAIVSELALKTNLLDEQRLALRAEVIAQLAMTDVELPENLHAHLIRGEPVWDARFERYAAGVGTNDLEIFESASGKILATMPVPRGLYRGAVVFSPDARYVAGVFRRSSSRVMVWRIEDGTLVFSNRTTSMGGYSKPFFSPNSQMLAYYSTRGLELQPLNTRASPTVLPKPTIACFSPDSLLLAAAVGSNVEI